MKRPNIEAIKVTIDGFCTSELKRLVKDLIEYIESRGQVRTEAEIRKKWNVERTAIDERNQFQVHPAFLEGLEWVLEDSDPKLELKKCPFCCEFCHATGPWAGGHPKDCVEGWNYAPRDGDELKPIEKIDRLNDYSRHAYEDKQDEIIDRLNEIDRALPRMVEIK